VTAAMDQLRPVHEKRSNSGVVLVEIPTDYSKNVEIGQRVIPEAWD
jgi:hypothetical protein